MPPLVCDKSISRPCAHCSEICSTASNNANLRAELSKRTSLARWRAHADIPWSVKYIPVCRRNYKFTYIRHIIFTPVHNCTTSRTRLYWRATFVRTKATSVLTVLVNFCRVPTSLTIFEILNDWKSFVESLLCFIITLSPVIMAADNKGRVLSTADQRLIIFFLEKYV